MSVVGDVDQLVTDALGSLDSAEQSIKDARAKFLDLQQAVQLVETQDAPAPEPAPAPAPAPDPVPAPVDSPPADAAPAPTDPMGAPTDPAA